VNDSASPRAIGIGNIGIMMQVNGRAQFNNHLEVIVRGLVSFRSNSEAQSSVTASPAEALVIM